MSTEVDRFQSEQINELAAAIVKAQLALVPAAKDHVNPFFKSKYADLPAVWAAARPFLENGIAITQSPMDAPDGYIVLETQLTHVSGQWKRSLLKVRVAKDDPQGYGSALTYTRRYALGAMTGLVTEEDDDGNAASMPQKERTYQAAQQHKQTAQAKIAELAKEMQEPARQEVHKPASSTSATGTDEHMLERQQSPAAPSPAVFIWRVGKHKGRSVLDIDLDYLTWACTNMQAEDHRQAAADEIDRRQKQDVMAFEGQG